MQIAEDVVYAAVGLLLVASAVVALVAIGWGLVKDLDDGTPGAVTAALGASVCTAYYPRTRLPPALTGPAVAVFGQCPLRSPGRSLCEHLAAAHHRRDDRPHAAQHGAAAR